MQAQSRFSVSAGPGSSSSVVSADEHEAVIRELTRGHELTAQLRAEALRALRGQGQAEDTAAFILQEVSRAFTVCLSIMSSPARAPPPELPEQGRRHRDENVPRRKIVTYAPYSDGYLWRKYGQKRIVTNTTFPRCYYRCSYHRERGCPATKRVQQLSTGDPPPYVVVYVNEHTCATAAWEPNRESPAANPLRDLPGMARQQGGGLLGGERGAQEENERQALVSSLACVLGAQSPAASGSGSVQLQPLLSASASVVDPSGGGGGGGELPRLDVDSGLDVMDYDMTDEVYFGNSYGLSDNGLQF